MDNPFFFNFLDYIYIAIMLISSAFGFAKGFTHVFMSLCAWIGSGFASTILSPHLYPFVKQYFTEKSIIKAVSIGIAYVISLVILLLITHFVSDNIKRSILSGLDRAMGVLIGLLRGIFFPFCVCTILLMCNISLKKFEILEKSRISNIIFDVASIVIAPDLEKQDSNNKKNSNKKFSKMLKIKKSAEETLKVSKIKIIPKEKLNKK